MSRWTRVIAICSLALTGCSRSSPPASATDKVVGPDPRSLSHEQLMAIFHECHAFGQIDDSRVKYSMPYCASVETAHASEGWTTPSSAAVDPKLNGLH